MLSHLCALNMYTIHFMYDNSKATNIFYFSMVKKRARGHCMFTVSYCSQMYLLVNIPEAGQGRPRNIKSVQPPSEGDRRFVTFIFGTRKVIVILPIEMFFPNGTDLDTLDEI